MTRLWTTICTTIVVLVLIQAAVAQVHIPTKTITDDPVPNLVRKILVVDAQWAWLQPGAGTPQPIELISGTALNGDINLVGSNGGTPGTEPIRWRLKPGNYTLKMWGYPDDPANPLRNTLVETFDIVVTREDQVLQATDELTAALIKILSLDLQPEDLDAISQ